MGGRARRGRRARWGGQRWGEGTGCRWQQADFQGNIGTSRQLDGLQVGFVAGVAHLDFGESGIEQHGFRERCLPELVPPDFDVRAGRIGDDGDRGHPGPGISDQSFEPWNFGEQQRGSLTLELHVVSQGLREAPQGFQRPGLVVQEAGSRIAFVSIFVGDQGVAVATALHGIVAVLLELLAVRLGVRGSSPPRDKHRGG